MRFRVLGTLEVRSLDGPCRLAAAKQRNLLAVLLLNANQPVDIGRLVDALWPDGPPRTAPVALRTYVSALRRSLGLAGRSGLPRLGTVPGGYQLYCAPGDLDLLAFDDLVTEGRRALAAGAPETAADRLRHALGLWRGRPFEDVVLDAGLRTELIRLEERRFLAQESWLEAQLALGHHEDVLAELLELVTTQPLREPLWAMWMLALYRSGRQAEALRAYRDLRRHLVRELGVEPGQPLRRLHQQILTSHPDLAAPVRPAYPYAIPVPRQLPADIRSFVGRQAELTRLLTIADDRPQALMINAIDGMAGIGKTALAVHAAHRLADLFVDGQLFVDLQGFTDGVSPIAPADALDCMLRGLGLSGEQIPHALEARAALYRTRLATKRVLIVLDNAATEEQVRPLLPGAPTCLVLITSRVRLTISDAEPLTLSALPSAEALELFVRTAGEARLRSTESDLLTRIVDLCGRLPLAIRIAAARLRARQNWSAEHLADRLHDQRHRLTELSAGGLSVSAAIDLSYHHLSAPARRVYRLLGLHPGPELDTWAAAALADLPVQDAGDLLDNLIDAHLLTEPVPGRYRFHDLIRAHAAATSSHVDSAEDRQAALTRLSDHYVDTACVAMDVAYPFDAARRPGVRGARRPSPAFTDHAGATAWLDIELSNLLAFAAAGPDDARHLSATLHHHLRVRAQCRQALALHDRARLAAQACADAGDELMALCRLGEIDLQQVRYPQAAEHFERAMAMARTTGNRVGELRALVGLGHLNHPQDRYATAAEYYAQALELARATGEHTIQLDALQGLANVNRHVNQYDQAADNLAEALDIARATGNRHGELDTLWGLGHLRWFQDRRDEAARFHEQALTMARAIGNRSGELRALVGLGYVHLFQDRYEAAAECYQRILGLAPEIDDRNNQFEAHYGLGLVHRASGRLDQAIFHCQAALAIARDIGQVSDQARALHGLAYANHGLGHTALARQNWQRALDILTGIGLDRAEDLTTAEIRAHLRGLDGQLVNAKLVAAE
ncbi:MAG TPA: BTAD domain-containing putative transcriptional regulator [Actinophytocola sp.]|uniref:AfsR/SARP family transcriptional regulator n=1 Tax=Actinophytocola sp. TaxID=1872138 RepID=UPI002DBC20F0|nr:BTAD domain-containing putative transcriptional regulator [Actinophytocola sp.]HEU5472950.1 BTAD domain-containing putative transcriptional regulator [Actinophytocola sp.]